MDTRCLCPCGGLYDSSHRLVGLVVKASASAAEDPGFESRLRRDFSWSSHASDFKIGTLLLLIVIFTTATTTAITTTTTTTTATTTTTRSSWWEQETRAWEGREGGGGGGGYHLTIIFSVV